MIDGIGYYYNNLFFNREGATVPPESPISPSSEAKDIIMDMQRNLDIKGCKEVLIVPANNAAEIKTTVIDLDPDAPMTQKNDDIVIVMNRSEKTANEEKNYEIVDIHNQLEAAKTIDPEAIKPSQLSNMVFELKTYDSSLKVLSNMFKTLGMRDESAQVKKIRNFVRYMISMKSIVDGKATIDLNKMHESAEKRTELINSTHIYSGLLSDTLAVVAENLKNGKSTDYLGNLGSSCATFANLVGAPTTSLKLLYKLSSFDSNLEKTTTDESPLSVQNIIVLRSGIEALREVTKIAVLLTGFSNPVIATTLAVSGVVTGAAGLYLMYNRP